MQCSARCCSGVAASLGTHLSCVRIQYEYMILYDVLKRQSCWTEPKIINTAFHFPTAAVAWLDNTFCGIVASSQDWLEIQPVLLYLIADQSKTDVGSKSLPQYTLAKVLEVCVSNPEVFMNRHRISTHSSTVYENLSGFLWRGIDK